MSPATPEPETPQPGAPARAAGLRWLLVAVVLAGAVTVALWPSGHAGPPAPASGPPPNLAADRAHAALAGCHTSTATLPPGSRLAGVLATCLADGRPVDVGALLAGSPVLVNVWATWCQPCQQELPALDRYAATAGAVRVLGVQVQSDQKSGLDLLASLGVHLPMVYDGSAAVSTALRLPEGLPASYLVRPDGTATLIGDPRVFDSADQVGQAVERYLGGGGADGR